MQISHHTHTHTPQIDTVELFEVFAFSLAVQVYKRSQKNPPKQLFIYILKPNISENIGRILKYIAFEVV